MLEPKSSWIVLAAINGDAATPNHIINSTALFEKVQQVIKSPTTFISWRNRLVASKHLNEEHIGQDKFYSVNYSVLLPEFKEAELKIIVGVIQEDVFSSSIFNPSVYDKQVRFPTYLALQYFFATCTIFHMTEGKEAVGGIKHTPAMKQMLGNPYATLKKNYESLSAEERQRIDDRCKQIGAMLEKKAVKQMLAKI